MKRRDTILALLALGTATGPPVAWARPERPARRVATLDDGHESSRASLYAAFRKRMQELGYVEGKSYVIEGRWARAENTRLPALAAEIVALKPDLIVAAGMPAALAAKKATADARPAAKCGAGEQRPRICGRGRPDQLRARLRRRLSASPCRAISSPASTN